MPTLPRAAIASTDVVGYVSISDRAYRRAWRSLQRSGAPSDRSVDSSYHAAIGRAVIESIDGSNLPHDSPARVSYSAATEDVVTGDRVEEQDHAGIAVILQAHIDDRDRKGARNRVGQRVCSGADNGRRTKRE